MKRQSLIIHSALALALILSVKPAYAFLEPGEVFQELDIPAVPQVPQLESLDVEPRPEAKMQPSSPFEMEPAANNPTYTPRESLRENVVPMTGNEEVASGMTRFFRAGSSVEVDLDAKNKEPIQTQAPVEPVPEPEPVPPEPTEVAEPETSEVSEPEQEEPTDQEQESEAATEKEEQEAVAEEEEEPTRPAAPSGGSLVLQVMNKAKYLIVAAGLLMAGVFYFLISRKKAPRTAPAAAAGGISMGAADAPEDSSPRLKEALKAFHTEENKSVTEKKDGLVAESMAFIDTPKDE